MGYMASEHPRRSTAFRAWVYWAVGIAASLVLCVANAKGESSAKLTSRVGVVVTPKNFPNHSMDDLTDMFRLAGDLGSHAVMRVNWNDPNRFKVAQILGGLADQRGLRSVIVFNPFKADELRGAAIDPPEELADAGRSFASPRVSEAFVKAALELAQLRPALLAVATDVNLLAVSHPGGFAAFSETYRKLYAQIKRISPDTKVFVTFQWDAMQDKGVDASRRLIDAFRPELDLLAFSSEPRKLFEKRGPGGIPSDYYARMSGFRTGGDSLFVELGWPSDGKDGEAEQASFVRDLPRLLAPVRPTLVAWSFLHDVKVLFLFTARAGLISVDGKPKPAFSALQGISEDRVAVVQGGPTTGSTRAPRSAAGTARRSPGHFGIYTARLDGSEVRAVVTSDDQEMTHPRISPDGKRITLTRYHKRGPDGKATEGQGYDYTELMVVNLDGTGLETIIPPKPGVIAANGCWSPDGKSLIYLSTDNPRRAPEIRRVDLETREITRMPTPKDLKVTDPHWQADKLVFPVKADGKGADALWLMNIDGSNARQITRPPRSSSAPGLYGDFDPKLSPDGSKVAFMRIDGGDSWRIMVLDLRTGEERLLTPKGVMQWLPTWSSDGKRLLYVHVDRRNLKETGLYTMTPDGQDRRMVPLPRGYFYGNSNFFPGDGSSDSARIIYTATRNPAL